MHSTCLRWAAEPSADELAAAHAAFKEVAATWVPLEMTIDAGAAAVFEDVPFMHIPHTEAQVFWRSERPRADAALAAAPVPPKPRSTLYLLLEALLTLVVMPFGLVLLAVFFSGKNKGGIKPYLPGKPQP